MVICKLAKPFSRIKLQLQAIRNVTARLPLSAGAAGSDTGNESVEKRQSTHDRPVYRVHIYCDTYTLRVNRYGTSAKIDGKANSCRPK